LSLGISQDCNGTGIPDKCDIAVGASLDCNINGVPDECDLASGVSSDLNVNGIPDECGEFVLGPPLPGIVETVNSVVVYGATPGASVYFVYGTVAGNSPVTGCVTLGIVDLHLAGTVTARADGSATLTSYVPSSTSGVPLLIQAVQWRGCKVSNVVNYTFP
jgi:hypothetical protein